MPGGIFYAAVAVYAGLNLSIKSALFFPPLVLFMSLLLLFVQALILFIKRLKVEKRFYLFERSEL